MPFNKTFYKFQSPLRVPNFDFQYVEDITIHSSSQRVSRSENFAPFIQVGLIRRLSEDCSSGIDNWKLWIDIVDFIKNSSSRNRYNLPLSLSGGL